MGNKVVKLEDLVHMDSPWHVFDEVCRTFQEIYPDVRMGGVQKVFVDVVRLFRGEYPGFRACNIWYHNLKHTTDCFLAMARLIHGASVEGLGVSGEEAAMGLVSSLLHDTGYIQLVDDTDGTGAKYTTIHVNRSIQFLEMYFSQDGYSVEDQEICSGYLRCTGLDVKISEIHFRKREHELLGKMLGAADLLGQMGNRTYLERLPFLFYEFKEGGVPDFEDEFELMQKTPSFWEFTRQRLARELGGVDSFMKAHFRYRWGIDRDLYRETIENNIAYLKKILQKHNRNYRSFLRRGGLLEDLDRRRALQSIRL